GDNGLDGSFQLRFPCSVFGVQRQAVGVVVGTGSFAGDRRVARLELRQQRSVTVQRRRRLAGAPVVDELVLALFVDDVEVVVRVPVFEPGRVLAQFFVFVEELLGVT